MRFVRHVGCVFLFGVIGCSVSAQDENVEPEVAQHSEELAGWPGLCGGPWHWTCWEKNTYCAPFKSGKCPSARAFGQCVEKPAQGTFCTKIYKPVCGCDGHTYGNDCEAAVAGVGVAREGTCEPTPSPIGEACGNTTCGEGLVCCNASCGICTKPGDFCIQQACISE